MPGSGALVYANGRIDGTAAVVGTLSTNGGIGVITDNGAGNYSIAPHTNDPAWDAAEIACQVTPEGGSGNALTAQYNPVTDTRIDVFVHRLGGTTSAGTITDAAFSFLVTRVRGYR